MKRKAQISSQVFVYILAIIIAGVILLVGYKAIATIISTMGKLNVDSFRTDFENNVESISREFGSIKKVELGGLTSKIDEVCFIDSLEDDGKFSSILGTNTALDEYPLVKNKVNENVRENVFFLKKKIPQNDVAFYVENLDVEQDFLCLKNEGKLFVWLKGTGKKALLYVPN